MLSYLQWQTATEGHLERRDNSNSFSPLLNSLISKSFHTSPLQLSAVRKKILLADTPLCKSSAITGIWTSGRASGVSPVQGGHVSPPRVVTSPNVCFTTFILMTLLHPRLNPAEEHKKAWNFLLSVPRVEALALPILVEQTTSEPTPI